MLTRFELARQRASRQLGETAGAMASQVANENFRQADSLTCGR